MHYSLLATLSVAAVCAEPLKNANYEGGSSGKLLDSFSQSDLDFERWVDLMVEEGQVFRPNNTDYGVVMYADGDSWTVRVKNVACSTVTGSVEMLDEAEEHFCNKLMKTAGDLLAKEVEMDVMRLLCDGGTFCKLGVKSVFDFFHLFPNADDISGVCHDLFNAIQAACPEGGGVADTEVTVGNNAAEPGLLEFSYSLANYECVPDATHECFDQTIPE